MYVQVYCYCSAIIDPTLGNTQLKHVVADANSYQIMDINVKKINMATKCKLTTAMTNK